MADYQVTYITKSNPAASHEDITHIGNPVQGWKMTQDEAIRLIDSKLHEFYVVDANNVTSSLGVVREAGRSPYLRAHIDGEWNDALLSL